MKHFIAGFGIGTLVATMALLSALDKEKLAAPDFALCFKMALIPGLLCGGILWGLL